MAYTGLAASFRTLGNATVLQNIFSLENTAGSAVTVRVRRLLVQMDATAVLTTFMPLIKTARVTGALPTGGTALAKGTFDTAQSSAANVVARGATASDGGAATAITATMGTVHWQQYTMRMHTLVGQVLAPDNNLLPGLVDQAGTYDFLLRAGEALVVAVVAAATTSNPATNHYFVECVWDEI